MQPIRFIHISDTHFGPDKNFMQHGVNTYEAFSQFLKYIKTFSFKPDFIIHTGDITADCYDAGYELMHEAIRDFDVPFYFVTGNHDRSEQIKKFLPMRNVEVLSQKLNTYRFTINDHNFLTVDGRGPDAIDPHGVISQEQMAIVKKELETGKTYTIFIHYPALALDSTWFDENMLLTNGTAFHQLLASHMKQVRGVFFGHIHRSTQTFQDGIVYASVGSTAIQFYLNPDDQKMPMVESTGRGCFNIVRIHANNLIIKQCSFGISE